MHSFNEISPVFVMLRKKKYRQEILKKLSPENKFHALLCLQRIKHNFFWKMKCLIPANYIRYVIAKLSKLVLISMLTSSESFLQRISLKRAWTSFQVTCYIEFLDGKFYSVVLHKLAKFYY